MADKIGQGEKTLISIFRKFSLISESIRIFYYSKNIFHNFWSNIYFHFKNLNSQFL